MSEGRRVALVTGGAGSIGAAVARALVEDGCDVVLVDRNPAGLDAVATALHGVAGGSASPIVTELTDARSIVAAVESALHRFGRLDIVVNNAGIEVGATLEQTTVAGWGKTFDVNVTAAMLVCQAALPALIHAKSGSIVNMASRAYLGGAKNPAYAASKGAIVGLTRELAMELGPLGIRVNAVAPSFVRTPFNDYRTDIPDMAAMVEKYVGFTPLRRLVTPADVANAVAFLASDRARGIAGEILHVCAGSQLPPVP